MTESFEVSKHKGLPLGGVSYYVIQTQKEQSQRMALAVGLELTVQQKALYAKKKKSF